MRPVRPFLTLALACLLSLFLSSITSANQRVQGWCEQGKQVVVLPGAYPSSTTQVQRSFPKCTVTVYITGSGGTLATIYSDNAGTPLANPFTADSFGRWFYYVAPSHTDVQLTGAGFSSPYTIGDLPASYINYEINVKDYGAVGDGTTNDTASIQAALTAASGTGATVYFPAGNYSTGPLLVYSKTHVKVPKGSTITGRLAVFSANTPLLYVNQQSNVTIDGGGALTLDAQGTEFQYLILLAGTTNVTVRDLVMTKGGDGITIIPGLVTKVCTNTLIDNVNVDGATRNGISIVSASHLVISNSTLTNSLPGIVGAGIDVETDSLQCFQLLDDIHINNLKTSGHPIAAIYLNTGNFCATTAKSIYIDGHMDDGSLAGVQQGLPGTAAGSGSITITHSVYRNQKASAIIIGEPTANYSTIVDDITGVNINSLGHMDCYGSVVCSLADSFIGVAPAGNVSVSNVRSIDTRTPAKNLQAVWLQDQRSQPFTNVSVRGTSAVNNLAANAVYLQGNFLDVPGNQTAGLDANGNFNNYNYMADWTSSVTFSNGVAQQVAYLDYGDIPLTGRFSVSISSGFAFVDAYGALQRDFGLVRLTGGAILGQSDGITVANGVLPTQFAIGDWEVDGSNHLRFPIYHLSSLGNTVIVRVRSEGQVIPTIAPTVIAPAVVANTQKAQGRLQLSTYILANLPACTVALLGTLHYCSDCKNVTDDTTGTYDAAAAGSGHGNNVLCENSAAPAWRNH